MRRLSLIGASILLAVCMKTYIYLNEIAPQLIDAPSFKTDIKPVFQRRCYTCHHAEHWHWTDYDTAYERRFKIKRRVCLLKDMPQGNVTKMTEQERDLVRRWIDQGAKK